jgi:6-phosphogluconolactonase/glucosamine-6-phosphate isomerase/deaminase
VRLLPVGDRPERAAGAGSRLVAPLLPLDLVHLGLGDDGHTASWPPGAVPVTTDPVARVDGFRGFDRLTLTPAVVNGARRRVVLAVGADKGEVLARWVRGDRALPIQAVRRTGTLVVVDRAAARLLRDGDGPLRRHG